MDLDLDTFLVTVYTVIDELYQDQFAAKKPRRPGRKPLLSDSEVLTLLVLAQWRLDRSERAFIRYVQRHWREYFPNLLSQSAFNRRARDLIGVLAHLGPAIAARTRDLLGSSAYEVLDGVPVPIARRCRGERHRLFANEATIGRGGSDHDWFYGVKLVLAVDAHGQITGAVSGPANTEEHWLGEALFRWRIDDEAPPPSATELAAVLSPAHRRGGGSRQGPTGQLGLRSAVGFPADGPYLADLGYRGQEWQHHWRRAYGATVLTKSDYPLKRDRHWLSGLRQVIETVNGILDQQFGLKFPRARTFWGLQTRLAAKIAAFNIALHVNYLFGRQPFRPIEVS